MCAGSNGLPVVLVLSVCISAACSQANGNRGPRDAAAAGDGGGEAGSLHFGVTPGSAAALSGLCALALLDVDAGACAGDEEFVACATSSCGLEACAAGACVGYNDCLVNSADPCSGDCSPPAGCTCAAAVQSCALTHCIAVLSCGAVDGGKCAALDRCCDLQPTDSGMAICRQLAGVSKVRGDVGCQMALDIMIDAGMFPFAPCADLLDH